MKYKSKSEIHFPPMPKSPHQKRGLSVHTHGEEFSLAEINILSNSTHCPYATGEDNTCSQENQMTSSGPHRPPHLIPNGFFLSSFFSHAEDEAYRPGPG